MQLFLTFVWPHLEYAALVWDPHQQGLSDSLERVQKFALKMCMRDWNTDYTTLLQSSNLPTLASRRHYLKLCFLYQVIQGQFDFPGAPVVRNLPLNLRNNSTFLLLRPVTWSITHQFSCFPHTVDLWNSLPYIHRSMVHSCGSLNSLKRCLLQLNYMSLYCTIITGVEEITPEQSSLSLTTSLKLSSLLKCTTAVSA